MSAMPTAEELAVILERRRGFLSAAEGEHGEDGAHTGPPQRYLLVQANPRQGGSPARWYTTHATAGDAMIYHDGEEEPWGFLALYDLDDGEEYAPERAYRFRPVPGGTLVPAELEEAEL